MPPDAGKGMYYSIIFVWIARIFNMRIFLHHRSFAYINEQKSSMQKLTKIAGYKATHIFLCESMFEKFYALYPISFQSLIVSNAQHIYPINETQIKKIGDILRIGHLSNLSIEKGLQDVIDLTKKLITENYKVELLLAGPIEDKNSERILKDAQQKLNDNFKYLGPVYDKEKDNFFREIDIFIFPTRYRNEAQPNVLFEASSYGVPSITLDRGCIFSDLDEDMGAVIEPDKIFSQEAFEIIKKWLSNDILLQELKKSSVRSVKKKKEKALVDFNLMINKICDS
jgi:glycosyltransferase involved in cell wall biosynthesis